MWWALGYPLTSGVSEAIEPSKINYRNSGATRPTINGALLFERGKMKNKRTPVPAIKTGCSPSFYPLTFPANHRRGLTESLQPTYEVSIFIRFNLSLEQTKYKSIAAVLPSSLACIWKQRNSTDEKRIFVAQVRHTHPLSPLAGT